MQVLGTPTEEDWPGVTRLPGYKLNKLGQYKPRKLGLCWPRLHDVVQGEAMASALLQLNPQNRLDAEEAMHHPYFNGLPKKCLELPDGKLMKDDKGFLKIPLSYEEVLSSIVQNQLDIFVVFELYCIF